jgi:signal transduction histidine kinase
MGKDIYLLFNQNNKASQKKAREVIDAIPSDIAVIRCGLPDKWDLPSKSKTPCLIIFSEKNTYKEFIKARGSNEETILKNQAIIHDRSDKELEMLTNGALNKQVKLMSSKTYLSRNLSELLYETHYEGDEKTNQEKQEQKNTEKTLRKTLKELQHKNKELEKINFELDRFVYSVSHDLRAPLTSVLGLIHLLKDEVKEEGSQYYFQLMLESIAKLDNTIRDILAYARNNRMNVMKEELNLRQLTQMALENLSYLNENELDVKKVVTIKGKQIIHADRTRLLTVLNNLLSNSIKYRHTGRKLKVEIICSILRSRLHLKVVDNGMGIEARHLPYIFDMFYRTDERSSGSGLGLYIVKETILKLKGKINVKSTVGEGTTIDIYLPL